MTTERLPLTPAQRGLHFTHRLAGDTAVYHVPIALRVRGPLAREAVQRAVDTLLARHQALRTTVEESDGSGVQIVHPPEAAPRVEVRWYDDGPADVTGRALVPFDLAGGPLWRVEVVRLGPDEYAVILTFHHLVIDEPSATVLGHEFRAAYAGDPLPDPLPGSSYVDLCRVLRDRDDGDGLAYWRDRLGGGPLPVLPQEEDGAPATALYRGDRVRLAIAPSTVDTLNAFCVRHRVSPFMVFHAALAVLLYGWTGEPRVAVGTPMSSRPDDRYAETVGFFQNTVVLLSTVDSERSFADLVRASRRTVLEAVQYRHTPFETVVEAIRPARDTTRNPLFQAAMVYNRVKVENEWSLDGLGVEPLLFDWPMAPFDLTVTFVHERDAMRGDIAYDTSRFRRATIEGLGATLERLLPALLADADAPVAKAPQPQRLVPAPRRADPAVASRPGPREEVLSGLFREVLGVTDVGVDDDFFELGGHSLLAGRLVSRVRAVLDAELSLRDLFEAPTVAGLVARMRRTHEKPATRTVRPVRCPLSAAQRGLWFLHRLEGPSPTYNVPLVLRFAGTVDAPALDAALRDVVARHESLRTTFPEVDGEPCQVVVDPATCGFALTVVDVGDRDLEELLRAAVRHRFDLAAEMPMRAWLYRSADGTDALLLVLHHIASDGWSLGPLGRDMAAAYAARRAGRPPDWPEPAAQYIDFTLWQRDRLGTVDDPASLAARQAGFWRETLAGLPDELRLPVDRPRPPVASHRGATVDVDWDAGLHRAVIALARATNCTVFMVLQAALATLLCRLGAGTDIPLGAPSGNRGDDAFANLVGFAVNTLVLRTDVSGDPTFRELVGRVREADLAAFAAQDLPFEAVVEALNPPRSLARHSLFQVMYSLQHDPAADLRLPGITTTVGQTHTAVAKFDLSVLLHERAATAGIAGVVEYATDLFDRSTVDRIVDRLHRLLRQVTADPDRRLGELDLLDPDERDRVLVRWQGEEHPEPVLRWCDAVAHQASRTPGATAVVYGTASLTYATLDAHANRLARRLVADGVGPDQLVAVALPRSVDLLVALLAVHKAGGAYLLIDPDQPPARQETILRDAAPTVVLTDTDAPGFPDGDLGAPRSRPADAAYVLYTSGSTGTPKGVVVEHRALMRYLEYAVAEFPGLAGWVRVPTAIGFDLTVSGLLPPLMVGGCVDLGPLDGPRAQPVSFLKVTPSHLALLDWAPYGEVMFGGEVLTGAALRAWRAAYPDLMVVNEYGPTETTVGCTIHLLPPGRAVPDGPVPIGRPVWSTQVYVLDAYLAPVPVGVPGELYVAGGQLARGYLNRPGWTAERFQPDPYGPPGGRMYRTGDLGRWTTQGELEYLGRIDSQVKVRGHRVEPGEIEATLLRHNGVRAAAVTVDDRQRLVAYVVGDTDGLRDHVAAQLPAYLVPDAIVPLDALPLSPNGKLDRAALPAPRWARPAGRPPATGTEHALARLFADVLDAGEVGVDQSFFAIGGHSLLAVRLVARIRDELGRTVPVSALVAHPTVADLASTMDSATQTGPVAQLRTRHGPTATVALVHPVGGTLFCYGDLVDRLPDGLAVVGCERLPGTYPPEESLTAVAERHAAALDAAVPTGPLVLAGWSVGGVLAHAIAGRLVAAGRPVAGLSIVDSLATRTGADRARLRAEAARLRTGADPELTAAYGLAPDHGDADGLLDHWAHLLDLVAAYEPELVAVPARLFAARDNPGDLPDRIVASWSGLCGGLTVVPVPGNHLTVLRPPAVDALAAVFRE